MHSKREEAVKYSISCALTTVLYGCSHSVLINSLDRLKGERNAYVNKNNVYHYTTYISILSQAREKKKSVHFKSSTNCTRAICTSSHENEIGFT